MLKKLTTTLVFLFTVSTFAYAQEKFNVSGEVTFPKKKGEIYIKLLTQQEFEKDMSTPPERSLILKPSPQQLKAKRVAFKFVDVPMGRYCIYSFQDLDKSGERDSEAILQFGWPKEPLGTFKPSSLITGREWSTLEFTVDKDISDIEIELVGP